MLNNLKQNKMKNLSSAINFEKENKVTVDFYEHVDLINRCGEGKLIRVHKDFVEVLQEDKKTYKKYVTRTILF